MLIFLMSTTFFSDKENTVQKTKSGLSTFVFRVIRRTIKLSVFICHCQELKKVSAFRSSWIRFPIFGDAYFTPHLIYIHLREGKMEEKNYSLYQLIRCKQWLYSAQLNLYLMPFFFCSPPSRVATVLLCRWSERKAPNSPSFRKWLHKKLENRSMLSQRERSSRYSVLRMLQDFKTKRKARGWVEFLIGQENLRKEHFPLMNLVLEAQAFCTFLGFSFSTDLLSYYKIMKNIWI